MSRLADWIRARRRDPWTKLSRSQRRQVRRAAEQDARALAAAAGPHLVAREYGIPADAGREEIARAFAEAAYHGRAQRYAMRGALAGFADYDARITALVDRIHDTTQEDR